MDELRKRQGKFLVEWAKKAVENSSFPISIMENSAEGIVIIGVGIGDGINESKDNITINKEDKEAWLNFFYELVKDGNVMINNSNYVFASKEVIDIILKLDKTGQ